MNTCPHCNRTLLSHASVRCNWCGAEIQDSGYLEQAQGERDAYFAHQRDHDAISLTRVEAININVNDPWNGAIPYSPSLARTRQQRMTEAAILRAQTEQPSVQQVPFPQGPTFGKEYKSGELQNAAGEQKPEPEPETKPDGRFGHLEL